MLRLLFKSEMKLIYRRESIDERYHAFSDIETNLTFLMN